MYDGNVYLMKYIEICVWNYLLINDISIWGLRSCGKFVRRCICIYIIE